MHKAQFSSKLRVVHDKIWFFNSLIVIRYHIVHKLIDIEEITLVLIPAVAEEKLQLINSALELGQEISIDRILFVFADQLFSLFCLQS